MVVPESIIHVSDEHRRVAWKNGSAQVLVDPNGRTKVVWIADLLPNEAAEHIKRMMEQGMEP